MPDPKSKKVDISASEFLVDKVSQYPGEISILALGPLTNLAMVSNKQNFIIYRTLDSRLYRITNVL